MVTAIDVPADKLIKTTAEKLKSENIVKPPEWVLFAKSGSHTQRAPEDPNFWYVRCSSLLRKIYIKGPIGVNNLREKYGGSKKRGVAIEHRIKAGGSIIRHALQQLQAAGLVEKKPKGRVITRKGKSFLDNIAKSVK